MNGKEIVLLDCKLPDPVIFLIFGRGTQQMEEKQKSCTPCSSNPDSSTPTVIPSPVFSSSPYFGGDKYCKEYTVLACK